MSPTGSSHVPPGGAAIHQLQIKPIFDALEPREKLYAHFLARAAWHDSRIIMQQVSLESPDIFDFIIDVHQACGGNWDDLVAPHDITAAELGSFLEYAGMFLCNLDNFYGEDDQKFVPNLDEETLLKIASISPKTGENLQKFIKPLLSTPPYSLGMPGQNAQSGYYPGSEPISEDEISKVSEAMAKWSIGPENTRRIPKDQIELADGVVLVRGDHAEELKKVCAALEKAKQYASNSKQEQYLTHYIECFSYGNLEAFRKSMKAWVTDVSARVENLIGFIEPYRDPAGIRSEWEAMIGIADLEETSRLKRFVDSFTVFIRQLPWAVPDVNNGKGPFEKNLFEAPDFTSVHAIAVCGSIVFEAANLPNYDDIREICGFKNIVLANRLSVNNNPKLPCYWVDAPELESYKRCTHIVRFLTTAIHELIGHGTGKLFTKPPISPLGGKAIGSHYLPGQTWNTVFGKLSGTVEECRAILVSEYLMDNEELLSIFGYNKTSTITADDLLYATYLGIGVDGLQALEHYNAQSGEWGQVHHQAHFSIFKHLLEDGGDVIQVTHDVESSNLTVPELLTIK
ncbi:dipeptidyl peptidase III [Phaeosphaeriaceae sp. PMI808]|nr:dipeptidyl peptidase III [Phaeosphaeriaceae sp. PMI808]